MTNILSLIKFSNTNRLTLLLQTESAECGLACLGMVAGFHGYKTDLITLRRRFSLSLKGATLEQIINISDQIGFSCRPLRLELDELNQLQTPAILHWELNHFVVLKKVTKGHIWILDPSRGERKISITEASKYFTGIALELIPSEGFTKKIEQSTMPLTTFWKKVSGLKKVLIQVFFLSFLLQLFALASPFFMQVVMDDIIISQDLDLLLVISGGFLLLAIISQATSTLRSLVLIHLGNQLSVQMTSSLFRHLLSLPLKFFESRHLGDIVSRFGSLSNIQSLLTTELIGAVLDGIMVITTLALMFIYLPFLAWFVIGVVAIYATIRIITFAPFRRLSEESIIANAKEDSNFMETIRAIQGIKIFGKEIQRQTLWHNHYAEAVNTGIRTAKLSLVIEVIYSLLFAVENIVVIYIGATSVINGEISIGMLLAFIAYKGQFTSKASALIDAAVSYKMLGLHLSRVADIAMTEPESGLKNDNAESPLIGPLTLKDISFRYDDGQPFLFENLNFSFPQGQSIAIIGPSGEGKTTLLKIMLGLFKPNSGDILDHGISIAHGGLRNYRSQVAAVMQDDQLLSGSLTDNISFFDPQVDHQLVEASAKLAAIHDDIMLMPMAYHSLVGDMGTSLSGGQKQRLLLARALYKQPKILFLDEATSHLDVKLETAVNNAIRQLNITRIIIAHRPETIRSADRIVRLKNKKLSEVYLKSRQKSNTS
ncbi:peptidase domain-containing ABC transporter [Psychrobium sp. 1_MG-2023]|uniref:peptidase domain-containing ABC transporter n=1 Tax=Psychrobium sp. 1_MG-2023 TaxID=3062624 RepID=UPI0027330323|nr:peptidase domain-containing ABC transporter [Psychrobium sp. 1_MG-2023]MDP2562785.1 peptidase domain-containing ABC transporter [Psychrobium sp. 1_MG-2023]